ncbi:MAG TPA: hypothetical protein PKN87_05375 [Syntrophomonadaceae bacterium]|nr:hypothetical protein [Syntrophomonadaceae bacterium]HPR93305.1 hypothetical protein [Syntrophomonadaceae bacterium]
MLDLDFAFFNLTDKTKTGLAYKKVFLDRLAPLFFAPRLQRIIKISCLNACGGNILLPLGVGNLNKIQQGSKRILALKTGALLEEYELRYLAVDRRLKNEVTDICSGQELVYGDNFIKALSHVFIKAFLSRYELNKIIIVGSTEDFSCFISSLEQYCLPVSIQTIFPQRHEIFVHQLLYEKGQAVSTSYLTPENWGRDDLVIIFADHTEPITSKISSGLTIYLNNCSCSLAPALDSDFTLNGLIPALYNLAPILESCLMAKAGIPDLDSELINVAEPKSDFITLENIGHQWGLWDLFLDKVL